MARVGEGDPRWIVNERSDGSNVNSWHWDQKDKTNSAKDALIALFTDTVLVKNSKFMIIATELTGFEGDVTIANRKGKLRCFFEIKFNLKWSAVDTDDSDNVLSTGKFIVHDCDTQNYVEDFTIDVTGEHKSGSFHAEIMKEARELGKKKIRELTRKFVDSDLMSANGIPAQPMTSTSSSSVSGAKKSDAGAQSAPNTTSITKTRTWYAKKADIYECFTHEQKVSALTRSPCKVEHSKNGKFSLLNNFISGEFLDLEDNAHIKMRWRLANWDEKDGKDSQVSINLDGEDGAVKLSFNHTGIPIPSLDQVREGWERNFWGPMKQVLGYGYED